jgi:cytoskeleton protein RodZ
MSESIGSTLKQRREARHLSIEQVAEHTRVRAHYLKALENDDLSAIPSAVQARGFLRIYADFLGLNLDELTSSKPSIESQESIPEMTASTPEPMATPVQSSAPASESRPRPSFLSGLRERFTHRSAAEVAAPEPVAPSESQPEPEEFVPARVHEELPAAPEEINPPQPESIIEPEPVVVKPARKASSRRTNAKKPVRAKAESAKTPKATKPRVKKKLIH